MSFSSSPWFFFPVMAAGLWLAYRLYFSPSISSRWRWILGALTLLAWLLLAGLIVQPLWTKAKILYHPPAVILAVDQSQSYAGGATLHSEMAVRKSVEQVRKHYEEKGFRIVEYNFTLLENLRRFLDSSTVPNLQGVFVWTDGRTGASQENIWPSPVFPVSVPGGNFSEAQGEKVEIDFSSPDSGADVFVEWRPAGTASRNASIEIRSGSQTLWKGLLPKPEHVSDSKIRHRFRLPSNLLRGDGRDGGGKWTALIRPERKEDNTTEKNDTVELLIRGLHRSLQLFTRPPHSLEERGLVDALFASDSIDVRILPSAPLEEGLRTKAILWAPASTPELLAAAKSGTPVIVYEFPTDLSARKTVSFTSAARITWREDAARFLPGEVLTLGDLGMANIQLPALQSSTESVIWVEEGSARGSLLASKANAPGVSEFVPPPVWSSEFRPGADERVRKLQQHWVQCVAEAVRQSGRSRAFAQPGVARDPMDVEMSKLGVDGENLSAVAAAAKGLVLHPSASGELSPQSYPDLPAGQAEETLSKSNAMFPILATSWILVALLCTAWVLRKKIHLD